MLAHDLAMRGVTARAREVLCEKQCFVEKRIMEKRSALGGKIFHRFQLKAEGIFLSERCKSIERKNCVPFPILYEGNGAMGEVGVLSVAINQRPACEIEIVDDVKLEMEARNKGGDRVKVELTEGRKGIFYVVNPAVYVPGSVLRMEDLLRSVYRMEGVRSEIATAIEYVEFVESEKSVVGKELKGFYKYVVGLDYEFEKRIQEADDY